MLPIIDIDLLNEETPINIVKCLHETSCLVIRTNQITQEEQHNFKNLMCKYYEQTTEEKLKDCRPETGYQLGTTPEGVEQSKCFFDTSCFKFIEKLKPNAMPVFSHEKHDPKWRYFWELNNKENVIPNKFKDEWEKTMNSWGSKLYNIIQQVTKLIEEGLYLKENELNDKLKDGKQLLAPTGIDISKYNTLNTTYATFHTDISFLTIHGKSNYPGLRIWLRNGTRMDLKIPDGCLLLQVGRQLEWLTGGYFTAGYHEVICTYDTLKKYKNNTESNWRVSSTLFSHLNSEIYLEPLSKFRNITTIQMYPRIKEENFIKQELEYTKLLNT